MKIKYLVNDDLVSELEFHDMLVVAFFQNDTVVEQFDSIIDAEHDLRVYGIKISASTALMEADIKHYNYLLLKHCDQLVNDIILDIANGNNYEQTIWYTHFKTEITLD